MRKPNAFERIEHLAKSRSEQASRELVQMAMQRHQAQTQLEQLQRYRADYQRKLVDEAATHGMAASRWRLTQQFLGSIDQTIGRQEVAIGKIEEQVVNKRLILLDLKRNENSMGALINRHRLQAMEKAGKADQKVTDEIASRRVFARPVF